MTAADGTTAILRAEALEKRFGGVHALRGVSLTLAPGRITGLVGPNGSGKTTALHLISGALRCDGGRVTLAGEDLTTSGLAERARKGIARTFQHMELFREDTAFENVLAGALAADRGSSLLEYLGLPAQRRRVAAARARAEELVESFGLAAVRDEPVGSLSYGLQRRVEIARALAGRPRVLLLDEPVAGMNPDEADEIAELLLEVARGGVAILLVEHNVGLVVRLCAEMTVLDSGAVIAHGAPDAVVRDERVVEAYLGGRS